MLVLAIDPGYDRLGLAIVEAANRERPRETLLFSDCLVTKKQDAFSARLLQLGEAVEKIISKHQPTVMALEKLFFATNQKTASAVAEVRGMLLYLAAKNNLPVLEYTPLQIKQTVTGYGQADKSQVAQMIRQLIKLNKTPKYDDEYDAIALALTALARAKFQ